jgi:Ca-activated chloride channel homolog
MQLARKLKQFGAMRFLQAGMLAMVVTASPVAGAARQEPHPVFKAGVDRVAVATVVRTRDGKLVNGLTQSDFELIDSGHPRPISEFRTEQSPVSLALLADSSGSMALANKPAVVQACVGHLLSWLTPGEDQVGLFAFDKRLRELSPLGPAPGDVMARLDSMRPYGVTSLFDAIAETGRTLAAKGGARRGVVALTDGGDNASTLSPGQASSIASSIDVPVYLIVVISPFDRSGSSTTDDQHLDAQLEGALAQLAHWTGGEIYAALGPAQESAAAQQIVAELRHEYLIVFEPDTRPGWHPIEIRTRQKDLIVRARSGYYVQDRPAQ